MSMNFLDYYKEHGDVSGAYYIVTTFGCNSTPSDLWIPLTSMFTDLSKAYEHYLKVSPDDTDLDNYAKQYTPVFNPADLTRSYLIITSCTQQAGYPRRGERDDGTQINFAKRPSGAVLARIIAQ